MADNPYINKVVYGNEVLMDLTQDTVTAEHVLAGITTHVSSGAVVSGNIQTYNGDYIVNSNNTGGQLDG